MVFPNKCLHLNFKLNIFHYRKTPCPLKEKPGTSSFTPLVLLLPPHPPSPFMELLTLVHSWIALKVESKPSHVGALDNMHPFGAFFLCNRVGLWSASHLEGKAARGVADIVIQWQWPFSLDILMNWDGYRGLTMAPQSPLLTEHKCNQCWTENILQQDQDKNTTAPTRCH